MLLITGAVLIGCVGGPDIVVVCVVDHHVPIVLDNQVGIRAAECFSAPLGIVVGIV